jgi:imidazole glycerol-phosphate synthase subunit HisH
VIVIVDYKAGNLASVAKAFAHLGAGVCVTEDPTVVAAASKLVLPGVGHFAATSTLDRAGLREALSQAIARGVPFLGICVGMQWLYEGSDEAPGTKGLGFLEGSCRRFLPGVKSPHVGWNRLRARGTSRLLHGLDDASFVYFTHSYRAPVTEEACGITSYGGDFAAAVERENVFGVQFHPEKSGVAGLAILRNFVELPC